jgi:hypothetical protein
LARPTTKGQNFQDAKRFIAAAAEAAQSLKHFFFFFFFFFLQPETFFTQKDEREIF